MSIRLWLKGGGDGAPLKIYPNIYPNAGLGLWQTLADSERQNNVENVRNQWIN